MIYSSLIYTISAIKNVRLKSRYRQIISSGVSDYPNQEQKKSLEFLGYACLLMTVYAKQISTKEDLAHFLDYVPYVNTSVNTLLVYLRDALEKLASDLNDSLEE